jgi:23S rRNA (uracil1939-C5)-methyltransferase
MPTNNGKLMRMASGADTEGPTVISGNGAQVARIATPMARTLRAGEVPLTVVRCPHAAECAGCPLIHLDYAQQLTTKRARVVTAMCNYPSLELLYTRPVTPADPMVGYRGRAKLVVSPDGRVGLYGRMGSHEVVDIPECKVLAPAILAVAAALRRLLASPARETRALLQPYHPFGEGSLRALDLREVRLSGRLPFLQDHVPVSSLAPREACQERDESLDIETGSVSASARELETVGVLLTFVLQRDRAAGREELRAAGRLVRPMLPNVVGLAANFHEVDAPQILGSETIHLDGATRAQDRIGNTYHLASFGSFVQAHREQASRVHAMIVREVGSLDLQGPQMIRQPERPRVLDLYGGSGAISLALARSGYQVTMVESFGPAAANARAAAELQSLKLDVRAGDVADVVATFVEAGETFDGIVINPPRRGISPAAREAIALLGAPLLLYVSCDPDTLARDLDHFGRLGYNASEMVPFDMIPLTEEVETVSVLRRSPAAAPRVVFEDDDIIVVDKGPHESVVQDDGEYGSSLLGRCARLRTAVDSTLEPIHRLDAGTSGLCMLARNEATRAVWASALAASGRLIYLAAAKGVTPAKGAISRDLREGGRSYPARTRYRRLAIAAGHSILRVIPDGGRAHQIRRHLSAIGHPVIGDERYGHLPTNRYFEEKHGLDRSFLHLVRIEVTHPRTGVRLLIESALPGDLRSAVERSTGSSVLRFLEQKHALGDQRASSVPPPMGDDNASGARISPFTGEAGGRSSSFLPGDPPPSPRVTPADVATEPRSTPASELLVINVPDLDEAPRTLRHAILSDDED